MPELLAPAGDWDALRAAVANGADAVYFGLEEFNARRRAANFTLDGLPDVMAYLHARNTRGYVAFNTLIFSEELPRAVDYVAAIARAGADAVIVQDLGLVRLISRIAPTLPIHASTQMTQTEPRGIEYLRSLGVRRVILARELSLTEIAKVASETSAELEVFVHGALCISYSGQCLASESLFGRSANRGECAQACRLPYQLVLDGQIVTGGDDEADESSGASLARTSDPGPRNPTYLLSPQDLAAHDRVAELVRLGVSGFKIEGRLKGAHYVAAATRIYRAAIDAAVAGRSFAPSRQQELDLTQSFSRGFTHGFLDGPDHQELVRGRSPKSRGIRVGTVVARTPQGIVIEIEPSALADGAAPLPLKPGDGVVFDEGRPDRDEQGGRVYSVSPVHGSAKADRGRHGGKRGEPRRPVARQVELQFGWGDVNMAAISVGSTVWKTDDPAVRRRLENSFSRDQVVRRVPVTARVWASAGETLGVTFLDDAGHEVHVASAQPVQEAQKHSLTLELLREQLGRLGDTPFELTSVELRGPGGVADVLPVMVPKSVLNDVRRRAVQTLLDFRAAAARHAVSEPDALEVVRREAASLALRGRDEGSDAIVDTAVRHAVSMPERPPRLYVLVRSEEQLDAVIEWTQSQSGRPLAMVYCDFADVRRYADAVARGRAADVPIGLATPQILKPEEDRLLLEIARADPHAVLVRNLGGLSFLRQHAPQLDLIGDYSLNVANEVTAAVLVERGLARIVPSCDLDWLQLETLLRRASPAWFEIVVHQHIPMFHTQHCLFAARLSHGTDCGNCGRPCGRHTLSLRDRVGADHPVIVDAAGRNTVFNGAAQSALRVLPEMVGRGVRHFRVELLRETPAEVCESMESVTRALSLAAV